MNAEQYLAEALKVKVGLNRFSSNQLASQIAKNQKILSISENDDRTQLRNFRNAKGS